VLSGFLCNVQPQSTKIQTRHECGLGMPHLGIADPGNTGPKSMLSGFEITPDIIRTKLSKFKLNKAPGVDGIVPRILGENVDILSEPLLYIFRKSIECDCKCFKLFSRRVIKCHHVIIDLLA